MGLVSSVPATELHTMKVFICVLLAVAAQAVPKADPAYLTYGLPFAAPQVAAYAVPHVAAYATHAVAPLATIVPKVETEVTALNNAVPLIVGGYKAVAGNNGDLKGAVHEVPAIFGAPALHKQVNDASMGSLTVGTGAVVTAKVTGYNTIATPFHIGYGKREAEADPALLYSTYGYPAPHVATYAAPAAYGYSAYGLRYPYGNAAYGYAGYPRYG